MIEPQWFTEYSKSIISLRGAKKRAQAFQTVHVNAVSSKMKDEKSLRRYREGIEFVIHQKEKNP